MQRFLPTPDGQTWICSGKTFWPHPAQSLFNQFRLHGQVLAENLPPKQRVPAPQVAVETAPVLDAPPINLPMPDGHVWTADASGCRFLSHARDRLLTYEPIRKLAGE